MPISDDSRFSYLNEKFGIGFRWEGDFYAQYKTPMYWLRRLEKNDWLVFNPEVSTQLGSTFEVSFRTPFAWFMFNMDFNVAKYTPFELLFSLDLNQTELYCYSISRFSELFDIRLNHEIRANECSIGALGWYLAS